MSFFKVNDVLLSFFAILVYLLFIIILFCLCVFVLLWFFSHVLKFPNQFFGLCMRVFFAPRFHHQYQFYSHFVVSCVFLSISRSLDLDDISFFSFATMTCICISSSSQLFLFCSWILFFEQK